MAWRWHGYAAWYSHWIGWIFYLRPGIFLKDIFYIGLIFRDTPFLSPVLVAQNKFWSCFPDSSPYLRHAHVAGFGIQGPKPKPLRPKPPGPKPPGPKPLGDPSWWCFLKGPWSLGGRGAAGSCHFCWPTWARGGDPVEGDGLDGNAADASPKCMEFMTASSIQGIFFVFLMGVAQVHLVLWRTVLPHLPTGKGSVGQPITSLVIKLTTSALHNSAKGANHTGDERTFPLTSSLW